MRITFYIILALLFLACPVCAEPVVIVNQNSGVDSLKREQVIDLFMGRSRAFPNGHRAIPCDQGFKSSTAAQFYKLLTGRTLAQINAYWARLIFTGRAMPPLQLRGNEKVMEEVRRNPAAIAYVDETYVDDTVKVIFRFQ